MENINFEKTSEMKNEPKNISDALADIAKTVKPDICSKNEIYEQISKKENEIDEKVQKYRKKIKAEEGVDIMRNEYINKCKNIENEIKEKAEQLVKEIFEGNFGKGELALVVGDVGQKNRLARIVFINEAETKKSVRSQYEASLVGKIIKEREIVNLEKITKGLTSISIKDDGSIKFGGSCAEADMNLTSEEDFKNLFNFLKSKGYFEKISKLMSAEYQEFKVGELVPFGGCSHHSGEISGYMIVLETKKFAIVSECDSEKEYNKGMRLWGVTNNPAIDSSWSAKQGRWSGEKLSPADNKDIASLKKILASHGRGDFSFENENLLTQDEQAETNN